MQFELMEESDQTKGKNASSSVKSLTVAKQLSFEANTFDCRPFVLSQSSR